MKAFDLFSNYLNKFYIFKLSKQSDLNEKENEVLNSWLKDIILKNI